MGGDKTFVIEERLEHLHDRSQRRGLDLSPEDCALLFDELDRARKSREFTHDWYANRLDRLRQLADENGLTDQHCSIVANGTANYMERPPDYGNVLLVLRRRAEKAERDRDRLSTELSAAQKALADQAHEWSVALGRANDAEVERDAAREELAKARSVDGVCDGFERVMDENLITRVRRNWRGVAITYDLDSQNSGVQLGDTLAEAVAKLTGRVGGGEGE